MDQLAEFTEKPWLTRIPWLCGLLGLLPLFAFWSNFEKLYWFHDDWTLLSDMQQQGVGAWLWAPFAENFIPVFKALWAAAVWLVGGSYLGMIGLLWATHVAILLLFVSILSRCEFSWKAQAIAVLTLGLPWSNIETLGWATQWSSLLATMFFLLAWVALLPFGPGGRDSGRAALWLVLPVVGVLLSALSFSRGVISGALLAFFALADAHGPLSRRRFWLAAGLAAITLILLVVYRSMLHGYSNFQELTAARVASMVSYAAHYELMSPLYQLMPMPHKTLSLTSLLIAGLVKIAVLVLGLRGASRQQWPLLATLLLLDLGTAALLALGRSNLPLDTAVSYRYQYISLLCFGPFLALAVLRGLDSLKSPIARQAALAVFMAGWAGLLGVPWARQSDRWAAWRGTEARAALTAAPPDQRFGLPEITAGRARELIQTYHLH
jgi:hypothetical protein